MSSKKDYIKTAEILSMSRKNFAKDISYRNMCQDFAFEFHLYYFYCYSHGEMKGGNRMKEDCFIIG